MISSKKEYESIIIKLLNTIISGVPPTPDRFPECTPADLDEIIAQCIADDLIIGVTNIGRTVDGNTHINLSDNIRVTFKGFSYLDSLQQATALEVANTAEKKSKRASVSSVVAIVISLVSLIINLLTNIDRMVANWEFLKTIIE